MSFDKDDQLERDGAYNQDWTFRVGDKEWYVKNGYNPPKEKEDDRRGIVASAMVEAAAEAQWEAICDAQEADEDVYNWMTHGALKPTPIRGNDAYNRRLQELLEDSPQAEVVSLRHLQWSRVFTDGAEPPRDYHSMTNDEVIASLRAVVKGSDMSDPLTILMDVVADRLEAKNG